MLAGHRPDPGHLNRKGAKGRSFFTLCAQNRWRTGSGLPRFRHHFAGLWGVALHPEPPNRDRIDEPFPRPAA